MASVTALLPAGPRPAEVRPAAPMPPLELRLPLWGVVGLGLEPRMWGCHVALCRTQREAEQAAAVVGGRPMPLATRAVLATYLSLAGEHAQVLLDPQPAATGNWLPRDNHRLRAADVLALVPDGPPRADRPAAAEVPAPRRKKK